MKHLTFFLIVYLLIPLAYAGPSDKWVYIGTSTQFDGIALILAIGAFVWLYVIYRDFKGKKKKSRVG